MNIHPLLLTDHLFHNINDNVLNILTNDKVIAINQDKLGVQGNRPKLRIQRRYGKVPCYIIIQWSDIFLDSSTVS